MLDILLKYYEAELKTLRDLGEQFAKAHPKIAGRLKLTPGSVADPLVSQLFEGFALLTARLSYQLDHQLDHVSQALMQILYPHYALPTPSLSVVQFVAQDSLESSMMIERHTQISRECPGVAMCHFRTCYPVTMWPLKIVHEHFSGDRLSVHLKTTKSGLKFNGDRVRFFILADLREAFVLHEFIFQHLQKISVNAREGVGRIEPVGFGSDEALWPFPKNSFVGYRFLSEYFSFPQKFLFFDLIFLEPVLDEEIHVDFLFDKISMELEKNLKPPFLALHCTPIINLFEQEGEPIRMNDQQTDYAVIPDRHQKPETIDVYQVRQVELLSNQRDSPIPCYPYFSRKFSDQEQASYYYWQARRVGEEMVLSFSSFQCPQLPNENIVVRPTLLCTNRKLAAHLLSSSGAMTFHCWQAQESIVSIFGLTPITEAHYRDASRKSDADLVAHLHWQQISLSNAEETLLLLKECLSCYGFSAVKGLLSLMSRRVMERHLEVWPSEFSQGLEITLTIDEDYFQDHGVYLFGSILAEFFSKSVSLHSFVRFVLCSVQRGEVGRWGPS